MLDIKELSDDQIRAMKESKLQEILARLSLPKTGSVRELKIRLIDAVTSLRESSDRTDREDEVADRKDQVEPKEESARQRVLQAKSTYEYEDTSSRADLTRISLDNIGAAGRSKKKWTVTDPAEIAPHYYHKDLFRANFPLVDIVEVKKGSPFPVRDKFESDVLDPDVTLEARRIWIERFFDVNGTYRTPENEKQAFPIHFAFLEPLRMFARPSQADIAKQNEYHGKRKWTSSDVEKAVGRPRLEDENEGFYLVPGDEDVQEPLGANRSDGDYSVCTEEVAELQGDVREDGDIPTGFADGVLHIFDDRKSDPDKVAAVLERKFQEDRLKWNARFQGGFYAVKHAIVNLEREHGSSLYLLVMTQSTWSYGILVPEGYVQVRNGSIASTSMPEFHRHQQMTRVSEMDYVKLEEKLRLGTEFYRSCYRDNRQAVYKDGPMLVGKLYLSKEWFSLPRPEAGGDLAAGGRRLFDGLLRLILGDSVCGMTDEDLYRRTRLRKLMSAQQQQSYFAGRPPKRWRFEDIDPNEW